MSEDVLLVLFLFIALTCTIVIIEALWGHRLNRFNLPQVGNNLTPEESANKNLEQIKNDVSRMRNIAEINHYKSMFNSSNHDHNNFNNKRYF
jgi:hypothetical protein